MKVKIDKFDKQKNSGLQKSLRFHIINTGGNFMLMFHNKYCRDGYNHE